MCTGTPAQNEQTVRCCRVRPQRRRRQLCTGALWANSQALVYMCAMGKLVRPCLECVGDDPAQLRGVVLAHRGVGYTTRRQTCSFIDRK